MAASTTLTIETTSPMIHPCTSLDARIAPIATPIPITPPVATMRMNTRSTPDRRRPRLGIMVSRDGGVEGCLGEPVLTETRLAGPDRHETISIGAVWRGRI